MINITTGIFTDLGVTFTYYTPSSSKVDLYIDAEGGRINIPATGDLPAYAIDEFIAAVKLAKQLSKGEIAIDIKRLAQRAFDGMLEGSSEE